MQPGEKNEGLHARTDIFSALTGDKRFSNANRPQRQVKQKAHVYKHATIFFCFCGLLRHVFIPAYVNVGIFASLKAHIYTANADKIPVQL